MLDNKIKAAIYNFDHIYVKHIHSLFNQIHWYKTSQYKMSVKVLSRFKVHIQINESVAFRTHLILFFK